MEKWQRPTPEELKRMQRTNKNKNIHYVYMYSDEKYSSN